MACWVCNFHNGCGVQIGAAAPGRTPCPNRPSSLEKAIRWFAENPGKNVIVLKLGIRFDL